MIMSVCVFYSTPSPLFNKKKSGEQLIVYPHVKLHSINLYLFLFVLNQTFLFLHISFTF
jgi:hypothetical protein